MNHRVCTWLVGIGLGIFGVACERPAASQAGSEDAKPKLGAVAGSTAAAEAIPASTAQNSLTTQALAQKLMLKPAPAGAKAGPSWFGPNVIPHVSIIKQIYKDDTGFVTLQVKKGTSEELCSKRVGAVLRGHMPELGQAMPAGQTGLRMEGESENFDVSVTCKQTDTHTAVTIEYRAKR